MQPFPSLALQAWRFSYCMKQLRLAALLVFAGAAGLAYAQDEERRAPPVEIPDFSNLDEYIYEPRSTVTIGVRRLSGAKTSFQGQGKIPAAEDPGAITGANLLRVYHDGSVQPDARVAPRLDNGGNPVTDSAGNTIFDPIAPDGKTNTWNYSDPKQLTGDGYITFHSYSAEVTDTATRKQDSNSAFGLDLVTTHDMGKLFGTRATWQLMGGMSINDLSSKTSGNVRATLTTITDYYSLFGVTPPTAPYSAPSSSTTSLLDASGAPLYDSSGNAQTVTTDTTVLIGNQPIGRLTTPVTNETSVTNHWKLKGAYYTFRFGPTILVPITTRLKASVSFGPALVYAGSNYTVTQTFQPDIGAEISTTDTDSIYKLLAGYYVDANLQFDLTEKTGFYAGAVFQSAGSYQQELNSTTASYSTKVDLSNQNGLRAGMSIRF
jgi:hypothetical protein